MLPGHTSLARIEALSPEDRRAPAQQCNQHESLPQGLAARLTGTINVTLTTNRLPHADIEGNFASLLICHNSWHTIAVTHGTRTLTRLAELSRKTVLTAYGHPNGLARLLMITRVHETTLIRRADMAG